MLFIPWALTFLCIISTSLHALDLDSVYSLVEGVVQQGKENTDSVSEVKGVKGVLQGAKDSIQGTLGRITKLPALPSSSKPSPTESTPSPTESSLSSTESTPSSTESTNQPAPALTGILSGSPSNSWGSESPSNEWESESPSDTWGLESPSDSRGSESPSDSRGSESPSSWRSRSRSPSESAPPASRLTPIIVGGRPVRDGQFPWMVALNYMNRFICSAFLISPSLVLTAAHCAVSEADEPQPPENYSGIVGNVRRTGPNTRIQFRKITPHPKYRMQGIEYDIAVFYLTNPVPVNATIRPICLPKPKKTKDPRSIDAMGWGLTSNNQNTPPPVNMQTTNLTVTPQKLCKKFYKVNAQIDISDRLLCTQSARHSGVCYGDSGGPAVANSSRTGQPVAIGITSFILDTECGNPYVPSVYTRTAPYVGWLKKTVGQQKNDICFVDM